jgi:hypothetical protein
VWIQNKQLEIAKAGSRIQNEQTNLRKPPGNFQTIAHYYPQAIAEKALNKEQESKERTTSTIQKSDVSQ